MAGKGDHTPLMTLKSSKDEVLSISSGESRTVKQTYASDTRPRSPEEAEVNSEDDFCMLVIDPYTNATSTKTIRGVSPPSSTGGARGLIFSPSVPPQSPPISPEVVVNGCPCDLQSDCRQECCVKTLRAAHQVRVEKVNAQTRLISREERDNTSSSSYGSMDSTDGGGVAGTQNMTSPVSSINCGSSGGRDGSPTEGSEVRVQGRDPSPETVHCECHTPVVDHTTRKAVMKLVIASLIALLFMVGEMLGENSLQRTLKPPTQRTGCSEVLLFFSPR